MDNQLNLFGETKLKNGHKLKKIDQARVERNKRFIEDLDNTVSVYTTEEEYWGMRGKVHAGRKMSADLLFGLESDHRADFIKRLPMHARYEIEYLIRSLFL